MREFGEVWAVVERISRKVIATKSKKVGGKRKGFERGLAYGTKLCDQE